MQGIKLNQVVLNLGLENNPYTMDVDIVELINTTNLNTFVTSYRVTESLYNGEVELTAVVTCSTSNIDELVNDLEKLCVIFTQERIAAKVDNKDGLLIDHPFMNLNPMQYDEKYFIN